MSNEQSDNGLLAGRKRRPVSTSWKPGQSGNPAGRKPEGQSWAGVIRAVTDQNPEDLAAKVGGATTELGRALLLLPKGVPLKTLLAVRAVVALMSLPSAGLLSAVMETEQDADIEERVAQLEGRANEKQEQHQATT